MTYNITQISSIIQPRQARIARAGDTVEHLLTDSRSLLEAATTLFFALHTPQGDGHQYLEELYQRGVRNFVVENITTATVEAMPGANILVADNALEALQRLARAHRERFHIPVIAITGSRGKTTVKEALYQLLKDDYRIARSPRSYNSQTGVPLSLWQLADDTQLAIIEAGVSRSGEMRHHRDMIQPTIGVLTCVGHEHDEGFASLQEKEREKRLLLQGCQVVVEPPQASLSVDERNAATCMAVMRALGIDEQAARERLSRLRPVDTRINVVEGVNNCTVMVDGYCCDMNSLEPAIDFMRRRSNPSDPCTVILGDLEHEHNMDEADYYNKVLQLLRLKRVGRLIGIGEAHCRNHATAPGIDTRYFATVAQMLDAMSQSDFENETILVKAPLDTDLRPVVDMLEARGHQTVEEIDLEALAHNFKLFKNMLHPATRTVAMVKASGYGTGSYEIAKTLQDRGADYLAVAVQDEGVQLRHAGITMPIIVLNPSVTNYKAMFVHRLEPEVYSLDECRQLIKEAQKCGVTAFPVHIKLDTGMHRLGFTTEQLPALVTLLQSQRELKPVSVFSHLCVADEPQQDDYTREQFACFDRGAALLQAGFPHHILRHILNTSGIARFASHQMDMVRIGIGLYGVKTVFDGSEDDLRVVASLHAIVISIKEWPAGTTIGYGRRGVLTRPSRIATVSIGYADGLDRHFGNGHISVWVNGTLCPTVGNVCMDAVMIDVTDAACRVGDRVEIFGTHVPIETLSDVRGTIPYEILTSISPRVKRVYFRE